MGETIIATRDVTIRISATDNFSQVMTKYNQSMDRASSTTKDLGKSSDNLATTIKGLFSIAVVQQAAGYVGEMINLGTEANATEARFRELTKTMGGYEETMAGLRSATLNTTDDMHLQAGAMLLIQTAGIETNEELERMLNLITMTKKPSEDMTTAINNFGLMLANNSILRLDSFGISASKVRARILELQATLGIDRSEAFRMAVMEEGEKNIAKFGDAAAAASTSLARLSVTATNTFQDFAQRTASGAQGFGLAIEYLLGITPQQQAATKAKAERVAVAMTEDLNQALISSLAGPGFGMDAGFVSRYIEVSLEMAAEDPSLMGNVDDFMAAVFRRMGATVGDTGPFRDILQNTLDIHRLNQEDRDAAKAIADENQRQADALAESAANQRMVLSFTDQLNDLNERNTREHIKQLEVEREMAGIRAQFAGQLGETGQGAFSAAFRLNGQAFGDTGVPQYMTQGQADEVRSAADAVALYVEQMKAADEANDALFSDEEIQKAEDYSGKLDDMADSAQNAADAFANMSLSEMFGQADGGRLAEEMDAVVEAMERMGAESYELANAQRAFDLRTGRETATSLAFQDQIAPFVAQVYEQQGADAAVAFMQAFDNTVSNAQLMGIDVNAPEFVAKLTETFQNPLNLQTFDMAGFLAGFATAADSMMIMAEDGSMVSASFYEIAEKTPLITADIGAIETSMGAMVTHSDKIKTTLDELSGKKVTIPVELEWLNIGGIVAAILPGLVQAVQAAGGVMPGTAASPSTSGALVRMPR